MVDVFADKLTPAEERTLMAFASERLAQGMLVCLRFAMGTSAAYGRDLDRSQ